MTMIIQMESTGDMEFGTATHLLATSYHTNS